MSSLKRIRSIDVLRGIALLGILLMNIVSFGMSDSAMYNPSAAGGSTGINLAVWTVNWVLFEGKMRAIFSMLFGASVLLMTSSFEAREGSSKVADLYFRRTTWLLIFGMCHAYLLWIGDILYHYALAGFLLFTVRKLSAKRLIIAGLLVLAFVPLRDSFRLPHLHWIKAQSMAADTAERLHLPLTDEQARARNERDLMVSHWQPSKKALAEELESHRSFIKGLLLRLREARNFESEVAYYNLPDVLGMMLLGMGLMKLGYFSAEKRPSTYWTMAGLGYLLGISATIWSASALLKSGFSVFVFRSTFLWYHFDRLTIGLAHVSIVMLAVRYRVLSALQARLAAIGQMALTCYFSSTILCMTVFDGYKLYGALERYQLYYVVTGVWIFLLVFAPFWMARYQYGPFEWVWRSLTYWKRQPMRRLQTRTQAASA